MEISANTNNNNNNNIDIQVKRITGTHYILRDVPLELDNKSLMRLVGQHIGADFCQIGLIHKGVAFEEYMPEQHYDLRRLYTRGDEEFVVYAILRCFGPPRRKICRDEPMKEKECVICYRDINIRFFFAIQPCMHTVCKDCGEKIEKCPMCRGEIRGLIHVGDVPDRINVYL